MVRYEHVLGPWMWPGMDLLGILFFIALLGLLAWGLVSFLGRRNIPVAGYPPTPPPAQPNALEILRQRYARGEIDDAAFQRMREQLEAATAPGPQQQP